MTLIATNKTGWANLSKMITIGARDHYYYVPRIDYAILKEYNAGIICLTGCFKGPVAHYLQVRPLQEGEKALPWWLTRDVDRAEQNLNTLKDIFGDRLYGECMNLDYEPYKIIVPELMDIFDRNKVPKVLTNDCHYEVAEDAELQAMMTRISTQKVDSLGDQAKQKGCYYVRDSNEMLEGAPWVCRDMLERTVEVMDRCSLSFDHKGYLFPEFKVEDDPDWPAFLLQKQNSLMCANKL